MTDIKRLLTYTPDEAILIMANEKMGTHLRPEIAKVGMVSSIAGTKSQVLIESTSTRPEMIQNPYVGASVLEFNRYDLTSTFNTILSDIKIPTTVNSILSAIHEKTGIIFTDQDFDNEYIDTEEYWLSAASSSKRWVGAVKIIFDANAMGTHISQYLYINSHDGLVREPTLPIWDMFFKDVLDGLELGKPHISYMFRVNDHNGLHVDTRDEVYDYLPTHDHDGLFLDAGVPINEYLNVKKHDGLYIYDPIRPIEEYLSNSRHGGLVTIPDLSLLSIPDPVTTSNNPLNINGYEL